MKFSDIQYENRSGRSSTTLGLYVNGNNWIPKTRVVEMWERSRLVLPQLNWSHPKTAKSFFEFEEWKGIKRGHRIALGRCLRYFAEH